MTVELDPDIEAAMSSLVRQPLVKVTAEDWLPRWQTYLSKQMTTLQDEKYALGHDAIYIPAADAGGNVMRFRSGSFTTPRDGLLYKAIYPLSAFNNPDAVDWESYWTQVTGIPALMHPAWTNSSGADYGASMAVAYSSAGFQAHYIYCFTQDHRLIRVPLSSLSPYSGGSYITLATLDDDDFSFGAMQVASVSHLEVFITRYEQVEQSYAAWQKPVYGTTIHRYYWDTGVWYLDDSFSDQWHTHIYAGLLKDNPDYDSPTSQMENQWNRLFSGGLAANEIDDDTVAISFGATWYHRYGYETHSQAVYTFLFHRSTGQWELVTEAGTSDYKRDEGLAFDALVRGRDVGGNQFLIWNRFVEPVDFVQAEDRQVVPRVYETVLARLSEDGRNISQFQYLGSQLDMTGATVLSVNTGTQTKLVAFGWRAVAVADAASFCLSSLPETAQEVGSAINQWNLTQSNRWSTTSTLNFAEPSPVITSVLSAKFRRGNLVRIYLEYAGLPRQIAQLYLDTMTPDHTSHPSFDHQAQLVARTDKPLMDTRSESVIDILPHQTLTIPPDYPVKHVARHKGDWTWARMSWPDLFFPDEYPELEQKPCYRLQSSPEAVTGGDLTDPTDPTSGGGGRIWETKPEKIGTWWNDVAWLAMTPMVDGCIETTARFGDDTNYDDFSFVATTTRQVFATAVRSNGIIQQINWRTEDYDGPIWNTVAQEAVMAGVICHAVEIGKKYAFVIEANSDHDTSSHTDDTWRAEDQDKADFAGYDVGANRMYLLMSDYDEEDEDWRDNESWIHRVVAYGGEATGITPGRPMQLRMQVLGGTIYCWYRAYSNDPLTKNQWKLVIRYKAGRFGAGKFGLIARGHSGIQWDYLWPGRHHINQMDNVVDFWNIELSDGVMDKTMKDVLERLAWIGHTPTRFRYTIDESDLDLSSGSVYWFDGVYAINPVIDTTWSINDQAQFAVILRGTDPEDYTQGSIVLEFTPWSGGGTVGATPTGRVTFRQYVDGSEVYRDYRPLDLPLPDLAPIPVRISAIGNVYAVWICGKYVCHFRDSVELGGYMGLYTSGAVSATCDIAKMPELYEVPEFSLVDINQAMLPAIQQVVGKRRIKGFFTWEGKLYISYFFEADEGPDLENTLTRSTYEQSDRFISVQTVQGACAEATYTNETLLGMGRHYASVLVPEIREAEFCYLEAKAIVKEIWERQHMLTLAGLVDLRLEPEDASSVVVAEQGVDGIYLIDDIAIGYAAGDVYGEGPQLDMQISTRQQVEEL